MFRGCSLRMAFTRSAVCLGMSLAAAGTSAQDITLQNPNFDWQDVLPFGGFFPAVVGWQDLGPEFLDPGGSGFFGKLDTGVFTNIPSSPYPAVSNASAPFDDPSTNNVVEMIDQLAFFVVNPLAGQNGEDNTAILQETAEMFELGKNYTFSLDIGLSVTGQAGSTDPINNPATIVLSIGYLDPNTNDFVSVTGSGSDEGTVVKQQDLLNPDLLVFDGDPSFDILSPFSVTAVDPVLSDGSLTDKKIVVKITQLGGTDGRFIADSARLTSLVPEPGSLALLGLSSVFILRRRRG